MEAESWDRLRRVAERQDGAFSFDQALTAGFAPSTLFRLEQRGQLRRLHPAVYVMSGTRISATTREAAGLLRLGAESVLSHRSAAAVLRVLAQPEVPWLTIPSSHKAPPRTDGLIVKRARLVESLPLGRGRRITPMPRTLVDLAQCLDDRELTATYLTAMQRDPSLYDALAAKVEAIGRGYPGLARARRVLTEFSPEMESILGVEGYRLLKPHFPRLVAGRPILCVDGVTRTLDLFDPDLAFDIECDSWAFHGSRDQQTSDKRRDRIVFASGVLTSRLNTDDIRRTPEQTVREILAVAEQRRRDRAA